MKKCILLRKCIICVCFQADRATTTTTKITLRLIHKKSLVLVKTQQCFLSEPALISCERVSSCCGGQCPAPALCSWAALADSSSFLSSVSSATRLHSKDRWPDQDGRAVLSERPANGARCQLASRAADFPSSGTLSHICGTKHAHTHTSTHKH